MEKIDVAIQSFKKPESLIYTLLSLKKFCGEIIDTIYINDDCSGDEVVQHYYNQEFINLMSPIKIKIRVNRKPSGYTFTLMTKEAFKKKTLKEKIRLILHIPIKRLKLYKTSDDIRYQWAINNTDKKYLFIIHDDIKFYQNIAEIYLSKFKNDSKLAIVGDMGGARLCPFGPCGEKCSPEKIMNGYRPWELWPITGKQTIIHRILGRYQRNCRINEWCCMIDVDIARSLGERYGIYFGNYEGGGDVGTFWFEKIIKLGYHFSDPFPRFNDRKKYYEHWWQGHEGHEVWEDYGRGRKKYKNEFIKNCIFDEFGYEFK